MKQFLASATVNGNEIQFVKQGGHYFIHWGEQGKPKAVKKIITPTGRRPSQNVAHKRFLEAVQATKTLKFSRL